MFYLACLIAHFETGDGVEEGTLIFGDGEKAYGLDSREDAELVRSWATDNDWGWPILAESEICDYFPYNNFELVPCPPQRLAEIKADLAIRTA